MKNFKNKNMKKFLLMLVLVLGSIVSGYGQVIIKDYHNTGSRLITTPTFELGVTRGIDAAINISHLISVIEPDDHISAEIFIIGLRNISNLKNFVGINVKCKGKWIKLRDRRYKPGKKFNNWIIRHDNGLYYSRVLANMTDRQLIEFSTGGITEVWLVFCRKDGQLSKMEVTNIPDNNNLCQQSNYLLRYLFNAKIIK